MSADAGGSLTNSQVDTDTMEEVRETSDEERVSEFLVVVRESEPIGPS